MASGARLLTIDCGNSTIDCLNHSDGSRLTLDSRAVDGARLLAWLRSQAVERFAVSSVVPAALAAVEHAIRASGGSCVVAGRELPSPLPLAYETPATLGADRWLAAMAAYRLWGRSLVISCGTATTCNLVDADGAFLGGSIAPGLQAFVVGMSALTPGLPAAREKEPLQVPARSSQAAVDSGVLLGYAGMVERLVAEHVRHASGPCMVVVTGGNAEQLLAHTRLRVRHERDLVHQGLAILVEGAAWKC